MGDREKPSPMAERSGFNKSGNWYERSGSGGYRYWNRDGGQYEYDGEGLGYYRNLRGTQYSEGRPYESYFDYPKDTREDFFLDSDHKRGDVDEQLIKAFEDQHLDDARDHREATDDERPHEQDVRYQEVGNDEQHHGHQDDEDDKNDGCKEEDNQDYGGYGDSVDFSGSVDFGDDDYEDYYDDDDYDDDD